MTLVQRFWNLFQPAPPVVRLDVSNRGLTTLDHTYIPDTVVELDCRGNLLGRLPDRLPPNLLRLFCNNNRIHLLPELPPTLVVLVCKDNYLEELPELPRSLRTLDCSNNSMSYITRLPSMLSDLNCNNNNLSLLSGLPRSLRTLDCSNNHLPTLPRLPSMLSDLNCNNNGLRLLPELPRSLRILQCSHNQLSFLPPVPDLVVLICDYNHIRVFSSLPDSVLHVVQSFHYNTSLTGHKSVQNNNDELRIRLSAAIDRSDVCSITMDPVCRETAAITTCGHVFTRQEITKWIHTHGTCPVCRAACVVYDPL